MSEVLNVILAHQPPDGIARLLEWWRPFAAPEDILLAYGGTRENFDTLAHPQKFYIEDPRLRTRDHQRELQSYTEIYRQAAEWLSNHRDYQYVFLAEYDHLPIAPGLSRLLVDRLQAERADALLFALRRIDGTNHPHYLGAAHQPEFHAWWEKISRRADKRTILSMLGTGAFWRRAAFEAVAAFEEPFPMYLEIYIPTLAHHLGFRLRDVGEQNRHVVASGDLSDSIEKARSEGAWTIHPVKQLDKAMAARSGHASAGAQ